MPFNRTPLSERLWTRVLKTDTCWLWQGSTDTRGYGKICAGGRQSKGLRVHRVAYEELVGPIPDGLQLDHLCRVRTCVRPDHLEPVTGRVNMLRGISPAAMHASQTQCVNGHPFDADNTYVRKSGRRDCRACMRAADQRRQPRR